ncbi:MAG: hypothetical protein H6831_03880 [Planctomycetes bacterium]|nr:hypothetical protein [Planctomycetota bacterium]MCB9903526.1 hypothetical protein [Planctomycetota bacterium]
MPLDELPGCFDAGFELVELTCKIAGLYTALLGGAACVYGTIDASLHDKWVIAVISVTALGLAAGWLVDLLSRLLVLPLLRTAGIDTEPFHIRLLAGAPAAAAAIVLFAIYG